MTQILVLAFVGFWLLRKKLKGTSHISLDTDWFYRKPADAVRYSFVHIPNKLFGLTEKTTLRATQKLSEMAKNPIKYMLPSSAFEGHPIKSDDFIAPLGSALVFILLGFIVMSLFVLL
ncbi:MAG: hypothetical protein U5K69_05470 [Balneolaceae bacterium]|nr:hypothetical protein [Balneolaceae bacterium]